MTTPQNLVPMLVITGGPCAGKSTVLKYLNSHLRDEIEIVYEAATFLGADYPKPPNEPAARSEWLRVFQHDVATKILELEAEAQQQAQANKKLLIVCDRGLADGFAYHPDGVEAVLQIPPYIDNQLTEVHAVHSRYHTVIHMESLAVHHPNQYQTQNNTVRYETVEQAVATDLAIQYAWHAHRNWKLICNEHADFLTVNQVVFDHVGELLQLLRIQRAMQKS